MSLKPFLGPPWPFAVQRAALSIGSSLMPQDGRAQVKADRIAHMHVERIVPRSAVRSPHAILYMHGGAFVAGSPRTHRSITRRLCALTGAEVLVPHYRLAPEHPFPAQIEDGRDGLSSNCWPMAIRQTALRLPEIRPVGT